MDICESLLDRAEKGDLDIAVPAMKFLEGDPRFTLMPLRREKPSTYQRAISPLSDWLSLSLRRTALIVLAHSGRTVLVSSRIATPQHALGLFYSRSRMANIPSPIQ
jgi:hypothetical protein